jgi:glycerol kinase
MAKYVMALDSGTTSNRCILFNERGEMCSVAQKEFTQYFPQPGWVEHDATEIWLTQYAVAAEALGRAGATAADIAAIGITNQRETTIVWDKETGEPIHNAIVWQDRRTAEYCDSLLEKGLRDSFQRKTGLMIDPYFSATKLRWLLENGFAGGVQVDGGVNVETARACVSAGADELVMGTALVRAEDPVAVIRACRFLEEKA